MEDCLTLERYVFNKYFYYCCDNNHLHGAETFLRANNHSTSLDIPCLLWNPTVHYSVHKIPPLATVLSQMHPVHSLPLYFPKNHYNVFSSTPKSSDWILPFMSVDQNSVYIFHPLHAWYMPHPSHPPWLVHPNNIWWNIQVMKVLILQSSLTSCHFLPT
jgi:hypothetical protein